MFNQIRLFEGEMLRVWARAANGHYLINPKGRMRWYPESEIVKMPVAILPFGAEVPGVFPVQDHIESM